MHEIKRTLFNTRIQTINLAISAININRYTRTLPVKKLITSGMFWEVYVDGCGYFRENLGDFIHLRFKNKGRNNCSVP